MSDDRNAPGKSARLPSGSKRTIKAIRINENGEWEDYLTTPRIVDLHLKLWRSIDDIAPDEFLKCLDDEECTAEELREVSYLQEAEFKGLLLHFACRRFFDDDLVTYPSDQNDGQIEWKIQVLEKLTNTNTIYARDVYGSLPLHRLVNCDPPEESIKTLLNVDASKSTLLIPDGGSLPLHRALRHDGVDTRGVQLLYNSEDKMKILTTKDRFGSTPMDIAVRSHHPALSVLAEEFIQLVYNIPSWRERLRAFIQTRKGKKDKFNPCVRKEYRERCKRAKVFTGVFHETIADFETLGEKVLPLIELAVWKGRGLSEDPKERRARWITCGAFDVAKGVAEYLGTNPVSRFQEKIEQWEASRADSDSSQSSDDGSDSEYSYESTSSNESD